jgi:hypothetical protein
VSLLNNELKIRSKKYLVQSRSFAEMLEATIRKYQNRTIEAAPEIRHLTQPSPRLRRSGKFFRRAFASLRLCVKTVRVFSAFTAFPPSLHFGAASRRDRRVVRGCQRVDCGWLRVESSEGFAFLAFFSAFVKLPPPQCSDASSLRQASTSQASRRDQCVVSAFAKATARLAKIDLKPEERPKIGENHRADSPDPRREPRLRLEAYSWVTVS